ncbi:hypothetical protein AT4G33735, partial [Arabidopsis thaliana]
MRKHYV